MSASLVDTAKTDRGGGDAAAPFARYLADKRHIAADAVAPETAEGRDGQILKRLWERTELPAHEFANEVAAFYRLPRVHLPQLLSASALVQNFARRFLRETEAFPYRDEQGGLHLAIADPTDTACVRAAAEPEPACTQLF